MGGLLDMRTNRQILSQKCNYSRTSSLTYSRLDKHYLEHSFSFTLCIDFVADMLEENEYSWQAFTMSLVQTDSCIFCGRNMENQKQLFFQCPFSAQVWVGVLKHIRIKDRVLGWQTMINWFNSPTTWKTRLHKNIGYFSFVSAVFHIWKKK